MNNTTPSKEIPYEGELKSILNRIEAGTGKKYKIILKSLFENEREKYVVGVFKDRSMTFKVTMDTSYISRGVFWNSKISLNQETIDVSGIYDSEEELNDKIGMADFFCTSGDINPFNLGDKYIYFIEGSGYTHKIGTVTYY